MNNREKIICAIEKAKKQSEEYALDRIIVPFREADMILALLKKQEAKPIVYTDNPCTGLPVARCPKCGKSLDRYLYGRRQEGEINFCPYCGQAVKWE